MQCNKCAGGLGYVVDSRATGLRRVRRRRECDRCGHRWTTMEVSTELIEALEEKYIAFQNTLNEVRRNTE